MCIYKHINFNFPLHGTATTIAVLSVSTDKLGKLL